MNDKTKLNVHVPLLAVNALTLWCAAAVLPHPMQWLAALIGVVNAVGVAFHFANFEP
jgi:hypothetical protein